MRLSLIQNLFQKKFYLLIFIIFLLFIFVDNKTALAYQCPYKIDCGIDANGVCKVTQWAPDCVGTGDPFYGICYYLSAIGPDCRCIDNVCSPDCEQRWRREYNKKCCWSDYDPGPVCHPCGIDPSDSSRCCIDASCPGGIVFKEESGSFALSQKQSWFAKSVLAAENGFSAQNNLEKKSQAEKTFFSFYLEKIKVFPKVILSLLSFHI